MAEHEHSERPRRVQLSRKKGWRMPPNTLSVARPGKWGNPYQIVEGRGGLRRFGVRLGGRVIATPLSFRRALEWAISAYRKEVVPGLDLEPLRGKNLACWCRLDQPCHADVLLELANDPNTSEVSHG